ncbi:MAG: hypothetical protein P8Y02_12570, partial [Deinococcales bacterium]
MHEHRQAVLRDEPGAPCVLQERGLGRTVDEVHHGTLVREHARRQRQASFGDTLHAGYGGLHQQARRAHGVGERREVEQGDRSHRRELGDEALGTGGAAVVQTHPRPRHQQG